MRLPHIIIILNWHRHKTTDAKEKIIFIEEEIMLYTHTRQPSTTRRRHSEVGELTMATISTHANVRGKYKCESSDGSDFCLIFRMGTCASVLNVSDFA